MLASALWRAKLCRNQPSPTRSGKYGKNTAVSSAILSAVVATASAFAAAPVTQLTSIFPPRQARPVVEVTIAGADMDRCREMVQNMPV